MRKSPLPGCLAALLVMAAVPPTSFAALETGTPQTRAEFQPEPPARALLVASYAVVHDRQTGQPVCQISTAGHPELVPTRLIGADAQSSHPPLAGVRDCEARELNVIKRVAANAQAGPTQTAFVPLAMAAAWSISCIVGAVAGAEAVILYERYFAPEGRSEGKILRQNETYGAISGATASVYVTGIAQIWSKFPAGAAYELTAAGGFGLFCGAVAGLGTYTVSYVLHQRWAPASAPRRR